MERLRRTATRFRRKNLWPKLDAIGEEEVRKRLAQGVYGQPKLPLINEWLARRERQRQGATTQQVNVLDDKALELSAEANSIAREGNMISRRSVVAAWVAVGISVLALLVAIVSAAIEARN